ncbi:MAG: hypothetical protein ONB46_19465 [candidate division KSB1 bacterium]|nr:hypothetical protein [candidate division KSB1 bacterium]MDZ7368056.1 hypothetical protein [candidate division KSB1 bacterium]MDZ7405718.1 hypothetical protein [candidate division KSB1 bacterium]
MRTFRDDLQEMLRNPTFKKRYEEEKERLFIGYQIRQEIGIKAHAGTAKPRRLLKSYITI